MNGPPPLRGRAWRRKGLVKLVWIFVAPTLSANEPRAIKIGAVARALDIGRTYMRRAVRLLVKRQYLTCTKPPTAGTAGEYVLGPKAFRRPTVQTGATTAPLASSDQLSLLPPAA
jgi:hypothetical protein